MRMNTSIPMMAKTPDLGNALITGFQNGRQMAQGKFLQQRGADLARGDKDAMAEYGQFDPQGAMGLRKSQFDYEKAVADHAAGLSAAERKQQAEALRKAVAAGLQARTPEQWDAMVTQFGANNLVGQFENREAIAGQFLSVADSLERFDERNAPPKPLSAPGKVQADINSGLLPQGTALRSPGVVAHTGDTPEVPTNPGQLGKEISKDDADLLNTAKEQSANADALAANVLAAENIVKGGYNSGADSWARSKASQAGAIFGGSGEYAAQTQDFESVSKTIGMDQLKAIGGNDTERELLTAIQTTASADKEPEANKRILARQKAALDVITQKPGLMSQWMAKNGSLARPDRDTQLSWDQFWRGYQRANFAQLQEQYYQDFNAPESQAAQPGPPEPGVTEDGFQFMGGDPADPNNWRKVE